MSVTTTSSFTIPFVPDRCRNCDTNLTGSTPADQFQRLRIIQNTVRVRSSLYTMAKGSLAAYKAAGPATNNVCWNQMSDRPLPSIGRATVPSGRGTAMAVTHKGGNFGYAGHGYTQTASRPGAMAPGGIGCDIKHNSYARRLNRLKARGPLKQQGVPASFGGFIPFTLAAPVYGGKTMKTGLVAGCDCVGDAAKTLLYRGIDRGSLYDNIVLTLDVGNYVYALFPGVTQCYRRALVEVINDDGTYIIRFDDGTLDTQDLSQLRIYYPCGESSDVVTTLFSDEFLGELNNVFNVNCVYPNNPFIQAVFE